MNHLPLISQPTTPPQSPDIKSQFKNFINLLQCSDQNNIKNFYKSQKSLGKLSIIFSASQPQSSKQNSQQCSNCSPNSSQFQSLEKVNSNNNTNNSINMNNQIQINQCMNMNFTKNLSTLTSPIIETKIDIIQLISHLSNTPLTSTQSSILQQISSSISQLLNCNHLLTQQLQKQKNVTDQLLQALMKMDQQAKQFWGTYEELSKNFNLKCKQMDDVKQCNKRLNEEIQQCKNDVKFMKKLVYIANEKYQQLESRINNNKQLKYQGQFYELDKQNDINNNQILQQNYQNRLSKRTQQPLSMNKNKSIKPREHSEENKKNYKNFYYMNNQKNHEKNTQNIQLQSHRYNRQIYSPTLGNKNINNFYQNNQKNIKSNQNLLNFPLNSNNNFNLHHHPTHHNPHHPTASSSSHSPSIISKHSRSQKSKKQLSPSISKSKKNLNIKQNLLYKDKQNVGFGQQQQDHNNVNMNMNNCKDVYRKMILKTFKCKK